MKDHALVTAGAVGAVLAAICCAAAVGAVLAAICCAAPLLAVMLGAFGLTAWLANGAYVLIPVLLICLGLIGMRFRRRRTATAASEQVRKS